MPTEMSRASCGTARRDLHSHARYHALAQAAVVRMSRAAASDARGGMYSRSREKRKAHDVPKRSSGQAAHCEAKASRAEAEHAVTIIPLIYCLRRVGSKRSSVCHGSLAEEAERAATAPEPTSTNSHLKQSFVLLCTIGRASDCSQSSGPGAKINPGQDTREGTDRTKDGKRSLFIASYPSTACAARVQVFL